MNYSEYLGKFVTEPKNTHHVILPVRRNARYLDEEFKRPRLGKPSEPVKYDEAIKDIEKIKTIFITRGYWGKIPKLSHKPFEVALHYFRACLEAYDEIASHKVFSIGEIYFRCLSEGPEFTSFIKKSRAYSLQNKISYGLSMIPDEYIHEEYSGYDSIIHERYLINWDECDITMDWPYSLIELKEKTDYKEMLKGWATLKNHYALKKEPIVEISLEEKIVNKKSSTIEGSKTTFLKNTYQPKFKEFGSYFCTRKVIPIDAGNIRDTGVPDIETLIKLKVLHKHTRSICEKLPYSANCDFQTLNVRLNRLRRKSIFLHIDFKKFGFTFPREPLNLILRDLGLEELELDDFIMRNEDGDIRTTRGGTLGWFDATVSLVTISALYSLAHKEGWKDFDMLQFNDDIEIGFDEQSEDEITLRNLKVQKCLKDLDFILSHRKCYASKMSIFLEDYTQCDELDGSSMVKLQLAVNHFAQSLSTPYGYKAKLCYSLGSNYAYSIHLKEMCMNGLTPLSEDEYEKPVEIGGWINLGKNGLNYALVDAEPGEIMFFLAMKKYKEPIMTSKYVKIDLTQLLEKKRRVEYLSAYRPTEKHSNCVKLDDELDISTEELETLIMRRAQTFEERAPPPLPKRPPARSSILEPD